MFQITDGASSETLGAKESLSMHVTNKRKPPASTSEPTSASGLHISTKHRVQSYSFYFVRIALSKFNFNFFTVCTSHIWWCVHGPCTFPYSRESSSGPVWGLLLRERSFLGGRQAPRKPATMNPNLQNQLQNNINRTMEGRH